MEFMLIYYESHDEKSGDNMRKKIEIMDFTDNLLIEK